MSITQDIKATLQSGKVKILKEQIAQALSEGITAEEIMNDGLLAGMSIVGEKFKNGEAFIPEVLIAARCM
ncbi:MAG: B12-binding domain-containing protein, partial [Lachnospiraceae bacterium]